MLTKTIRSLVVALTLIAPSSVLADLTCSDAGLLGSKIVKNICWSCVFPIRVAGAMLGDGLAPQGAADEGPCMCMDRNQIPRFGFVTGKWNTSKLIEMTPVAFCSSVMGGIKLQESWKKFGGQPYTPGGETSQATTSFYNYHTFSFDLLSMLELFSKFKCRNNGAVLDDFDLAYMSEYDPTWNDESLALFAFPETMLFSLPAAQLGGIPDCFASSVGKPIDSLFWTVGCWGHIYPVTGQMTSNRHPAMETNLLAARALALEHRRFLGHRTVGKGVLCESEYFPHLPKSQYKFQLVHPSPEAESIGDAITSTVRRSISDKEPGVDESEAPAEEGTNYNTMTTEEQVAAGHEQDGDGDNSGWGKAEKCCHWLGESTFRWGEHRERPNEDDWVILVWNWIDCCMSV